MPGTATLGPADAGHCVGPPEPAALLLYPTFL
jgi:hypothetical protein